MPLYDCEMRDLLAWEQAGRPVNVERSGECYLLPHQVQEPLQRMTPRLLIVSKKKPVNGVYQEKHLRVVKAREIGIAEVETPEEDDDDL